MQEHLIPQDIVNYKFHIVGNLDLKQFGEVGLGVLIGFALFYSEVNFLIKWPLIIISVSTGLVAAFVPISDRPLSHWIKTFAKVIYKPTKFYWKKGMRVPDYFLFKPKEKNIVMQVDEINYTPMRHIKMQQYITSLNKSDENKEDSLELFSKNRVKNVLKEFGEVKIMSNLEIKKQIEKPILSIRQVRTRQLQNKLSVNQISLPAKPNHKKEDLSININLLDNVEISQAKNENKKIKNLIPEKLNIEKISPSKNQKTKIEKNPKKMHKSSGFFTSFFKKNQSLSNVNKQPSQTKSIEDKKAPPINPNKVVNSVPKRTIQTQGVFQKNTTVQQKNNKAQPKIVNSNQNPVLNKVVLSNQVDVPMAKKIDFQPNEKPTMETNKRQDFYQKPNKIISKSFNQNQRSGLNQAQAHSLNSTKKNMFEGNKSLKDNRIQAPSFKINSFKKVEPSNHQSFINTETSSNQNNINLKTTMNQNNVKNNSQPPIQIKSQENKISFNETDSNKSNNKIDFSKAALSAFGQKTSVQPSASKIVKNNQNNFSNNENIVASPQKEKITIETNQNSNGFQMNSSTQPVPNEINSQPIQVIKKEDMQNPINKNITAESSSIIIDDSEKKQKKPILTSEENKKSGFFQNIFGRKPKKKESLVSSKNISREKKIGTPEEENLKKVDFIDRFPTQITKPNKIAGIVVDSEGKIINNALIKIINKKTNFTKSFLKTNSFGVFITNNNLEDGEYVIKTTSQDKKFPDFVITLEGKVLKPISIKSN